MPYSEPTLLSNELPNLSYVSWENLILINVFLIELKKYTIPIPIKLTLDSDAT